MQLGSDTLSGAPADISLGNIRDRLQNTRNLRPLRLTNIMNHDDDNIMSQKMDVITFQLFEFHLSGPVTPTPRYQKKNGGPLICNQGTLRHRMVGWAPHLASTAVRWCPELLVDLGSIWHSAVGGETKKKHKTELRIKV